MTDALPLLIEIGTEELPPTSLTALESAFGQLISEALNKDGFEHSGLQTFATPRRLAVLIKDIATTQPDQTVDRRGPALKAAYDQAGQPAWCLPDLLDPAGYPLIRDLRLLLRIKEHGWSIEPRDRACH